MKVTLDIRGLYTPKSAYNTFFEHKMDNPTPFADFLDQHLRIIARRVNDAFAKEDPVLTLERVGITGVSIGFPKIEDISLMVEAQLDLNINTYDGRLEVGDVIKAFMEALEKELFAEIL